MNELETSFDIETLDQKVGGNKFKTEKCKDGINVLRILPPYGTNHRRSLFHKYMTHWGLLGKNGTERSYTCSYPTEGFCPICTKVFESQKELDRATQNGDEAAVKELTEYVQKFKARKFVIYNAVTYDGQVIRLELPNGVSEELVKKIKECVNPTKPGAVPYDPTNIDTGVWFEIKREGKMFKTRYEVSLRTKFVEVGGETMSKIDRGPLPLPTEIIQQIKAQVASAKLGELLDGPMSDIHSFYEPTTSQDLKDLMNGQTPKVKETKPTNTLSGDIKDEITRLRSLQNQA